MNREKFLEQKLKELTNLLFLYEVRHRAQGHLLSSEIYQFAEFYLTCAPNPSRPKVGLIGNKIAEFMVPFGIPCAYALSQFCIILKKKKKLIISVTLQSTIFMFGGKLFRVICLWKSLNANCI